MRKVLKTFKKYLHLVALKAIIVRVFFAVHCFVAVYRVVVAYNNSLFWLLLLIILGLVVETVVTIVKREGKEWTWFSPAIFLYLVASIPPIWLLELHLSALRVAPNNGQSTNGTSDGLQLIEAIGLDIPLDLSGWALAMEQALLFILILGRWFMPKGNISKSQLSQILLVYIGMAADIMELFEVFKEDLVAQTYQLTYPTLTLWSIALFQYTLALSTTKAKKSRFGDIGDEESNLNEEDQDDNGFLTTKCGLDSVNIDVLGITTTIIMQDGPFLCFRLYLLAGYGVISQMMVFFTCKNLLVILLQIYRLYVIYFEAKSNCDDDFNHSEITSSLRRNGNQSSFETISVASTANDNAISKKSNNNDVSNGNGGRGAPKAKQAPLKQRNRISPAPPAEDQSPVTKPSWRDEADGQDASLNISHPNSYADMDVFNDPQEQK